MHNMIHIHNIYSLFHANLGLYTQNILMQQLSVAIL